MNAHKNALKLLRCCLETRIPILVYEFPSGRSLIDRIFFPPNPLSWKNRLRIAYDIANVIAYLHTTFPRSIIHTGIKPLSFFLDNDCAAKLFDFSLSITLSKGEMQVEDEIRGTFGYLAPETLISGVYTEKNDVFSFGILLLELLIGKKAHSIMHKEITSVQDYAQSFVNTYDINGIVDPIILA
ncbi:non-functional pseudokinase ZED1-like [Vitis riparia]|uniref:non-functional pseudokinase ZED1-like n=1 Tax=Vitis riparia TaxID=96939 RepID=UPI00155B0464|nr:non-functional pseudokinase ZED1-like [Vitis riparia]